MLGVSSCSKVCDDDNVDVVGIIAYVIAQMDAKEVDGAMMIMF